MEDYEALLKESTSVAIERFPSIYNELLAVLKDGKTPLYYAFHSLRHAEPVYESIQKGPDENVDIPNMSYKDLVRRCQSAPSNQTASLKESTTRLLQIQELRFMVSDVPFLKEDLWATVIKHNVSTCIQIGENTIKRNDRISVKNYIIECTSWNKESSVTSLTVTINSLATGSPTSVKIMAFDFWEKCMEVPIDLLSFIELMNRLSATAEEGAYILIHCQHDISKAVLFAVMFAILTKMKKRRIVDILNPTVTVRRGVPYAIATYEQFKFIHDVVLLAIQRNSI